ncbi:hypothetical protein MKK84_09230 [Methylobacterium sp. E-065]|jgi:hypothetical protein|uniref:hypothetical protein n=1 Tax=Methylobacterium sp. E-065 TaxID=2836583 RepID=UPI001FBAD0CC|nr:hypothetical protein [Methylobacterium sp. E-065]MCJ2017600.1 hypothetical protein [Methylobacterium sp. E-065]
MRGTIEARLAKAEQRFQHRIQGIHRYTDDELHGLIAILRQSENGEPIDPDREEWAERLMRREGLLP